MPTEFVRELTLAQGEANAHWIEARKRSDFKMLAADLKKIVALKRREAAYIGYRQSPYDALLDDYEPGATSADIAPVFDDLKKFLVPFVAQIGFSPVRPRREILRARCPVKQQEAFTKMVVSQLGFDWNRGLLAVTAHPMCYSFNPNDIRMSTRYEEDDFFHQCFFSTVHEMGHGHYDQGMRYEYFGTGMCHEVSMGVHESQSRMWENQVGHSRAFWKYFYPRLKGAYGFQEQFWGVSFEDFYAAINAVEPALIRTDADEVTYNLHVIIRFEIEKALIEGDIEVDDLPHVWNAKMREYLGVEVSDDANGVLQDIHWPEGMFGYFPTYTLGNLYAAQFYAAARRDIPDLEDGFADGEFQPLLSWLNKNIHVHGQLYSASELVRTVTGEYPISRYFEEYLRGKYSEIYQV